MNERDELLAQQREVLPVVIDMLRHDTDPTAGEMAAAVHDPRLEALASARLAVVLDLQVAVKQALHSIIRLERHRRRRGGM